MPTLLRRRSRKVLRRLYFPLTFFWRQFLAYILPRQPSEPSHRSLLLGGAAHGHERITAGLIRRVAKDKLKIPHRVLIALRKKDMRILEQFEDLYPSAMKDYLSALAEEPQISGKLSTYPEINSLVEECRQGEANQL